MTTPWLEDELIDQLCEPLTQNAAKVKFLRNEYGLVVTQRKNGRPVVLRDAWEAMQRGIREAEAAAKAPQAPAGPNRAGLVLQFNRRA